MDEILDCCWMPLDRLVDGDETTLLTHQVSKLVSYGLKHGFQEVDLRMDELPSVYSGLTYKLFHRTVGQE